MKKINNATIKNLSSCFCSIIFTALTNFLIMPFIVERVGAEANGYVTLANNFVSYATIATIALNSVANRFIMVKFHKNDIDGANTYFSSVLYANIIMAAVIMIPVGVFITFIDKFLKIDTVSISNVRMLFILIFINFFLNIIFSVFNVAVYLKNKLYMLYFRNIERNVIYLLFAIMGLTFISANVVIIGIATLLGTVYVTIYNIIITKRIAPELHIKKSLVKFSAIKELLSSGSWNTLNQISLILNEGLDLLIANLLVGPAGMGILSVAKMLPMQSSQLMSSLASTFVPNLTKSYAQDNLNGVKRELKKSFLILGLISSLVCTGVLVCGDMFFRLVTPSQDTRLVHALCVVSMLYLVVTGSTISLHSMFTVTNKLKVNSIVMVANGIINTGIVFLLLKTTNLGVFAIAGVSTALTIIRNYIFTFPYAAKCIGLHKGMFYVESIKTTITVALSTAICILIKNLLGITLQNISWVYFILMICICVVVGAVFNFLIRLNKDEKKTIFAVIRKRIKL